MKEVITRLSLSLQLYLLFLWCTERVKRLLLSHLYLSIEKQSRPIKSVFKLKDHSNQELYLTLDLIGLLQRGAPVFMTITISYIEQSTTNLLVHWYFMPSNNTGAPITLYYDCIKIVVSHLHFRSSALILDFLPFLHSINVTSTVVWVHKN